MSCCSDSCLMCRMFDHVQLCLLWYTCALPPNSMPLASTAAVKPEICMSLAEA